MSLLQVKGLVKYYSRRPVVNGVDFEVNPGEVVGLLGPNGAGKTTSFKMAMGTVVPSAGSVWFNGQDVTPLEMYRRARLGMGCLPQDVSVFRKLTVEGNLLAIMELLPSARTLGRAFTCKERYEKMEAAILRFGLTKVRKSVATMLSGGEAAAWKSPVASFASRSSSCLTNRSPASTRSPLPRFARSSWNCATKASASC